jgi:hypothetical protein
MTTTDAYIKFCQDVWEQVGEYPLYEWGDADALSRAIKAIGVPPRCRERYTHIFTFDRTWQGGKPTRYLRAIGRIKAGSRLKWSGMTGEFLNGRIVKEFSPDDYPVPQGMGIVL